MSKERNRNKASESFPNHDHAFEIGCIMEAVRKLITEDPEINNTTKQKFLILYLKYKYHITALKEERKAHVNILKKIIEKFYPKK